MVKDSVYGLNHQVNQADLVQIKVKHEIWQVQNTLKDAAGVIAKPLTFSSCLDTRQPGNVFKKLDTQQSEILTNFLEMAGLIPLRT